MEQTAGEDSIVQELWWVGVVQGVLAVFFGLAALFWPGLTLVSLLYLFAVFLIVLGFGEIIYGLVSIGRLGTWWLVALLGLASLGVGVFLVRNPETSLQAFITIVGLILIARGLLDGVRAFTDKATSTHRVLSVLVAVVAILAGIFIMSQPLEGGVAFVWILGLYALLYGTLTTALAFGLRSEVSKANRRT